MVAKRPAEWEAARLVVAKAYDGMIDLIRENPAAYLGAQFSAVDVPLPDGLELCLMVKRLPDGRDALPAPSRLMMLN